MERKIGEIFELDGEWYQCVEDSLDNCVNCCFYNGGHKKCSDKMGECFKGRRSDNKDVCFKKLEKVGKLYNDCGTILQRFKIYTNVTNADTKGLELHIYSNNTIGIEIKQFKEDISVSGKTINECLLDNGKLNLKPFDIQKAKEGKPVCTRDGRKARIICFDSTLENYPLVVLVGDYPYSYTAEGKFYKDSESSSDLMMLHEKKEGWVNVYYDNDASSHRGCRYIYDTKERAVKEAGSNYITTVKINWEE